MRANHSDTFPCGQLQPEPKAMVRDPVYADFVLPEWREAELRAAAQTQARRDAQARAEAEALGRREAERRAQAQALHEAEQELAQLRAQLAARGLKP